MLNSPHYEDAHLLQQDEDSEAIEEGRVGGAPRGLNLT